MMHWPPMCSVQTHSGWDSLRITSSQPVPVFILKNGKHMEKMNSNRVKNSTLHLDSEIVHILSHLSLYVFFSFFAWAICSQHHTLPLKTSVEFLKKKDSCLHNHSFIITPRKINNCTFILVHIYTFPNVTSLIAGIFKNYVPVKVHTLHLIMFVSHFYSRRIFPYTHTFFSFF